MTNVKIGSVVGNYTITKYISSGSFGDVYIGCDNKNSVVAIKIPNENKLSQKMLNHELTFYKLLNTNKLVNCGISDVQTIQIENKTLLAMEFLGESLDKKLSVCKQLNLYSIVCFAIRSIEIIFYIHSKGILHRDIKPDNFLLTKNDQLYCIDFGLSKKFSKNGKHIPFQEGYQFKGTGRYASLAAHKGYEQSRKDDLESLGYVFVYLFNGRLPWQGYDNKDKRKKYNYIMKQKMNVSEDELCHNMPKQFSVYLKYVKSLDFDEKPRYSSLISMFKTLLKEI